MSFSSQPPESALGERFLGTLSKYEKRVAMGKAKETRVLAHAS